MLADLTTAQATVWAAAVGAGSAIIGGLVVALFNQLTLRGQRKHDTTITDTRHDHEQSLAAAARRHNDIAVVYPELMQFVIIDVERMRRIVPGDSTRESPPILDETVAINLQARVYAFASEPVKEELEKFLRLRAEFHHWARYVIDAENAGRVPQQGEDWSRVARICDEAGTVMDELRKLVRDELAS